MRLIWHVAETASAAHGKNRIVAHHHNGRTKLLERENGVLVIAMARWAWRGRHQRK